MFRFYSNTFSCLLEGQSRYHRCSRQSRRRLPSTNDIIPHFSLFITMCSSFRLPMLLATRFVDLLCATLPVNGVNINFILVPDM